MFPDLPSDRRLTDAERAQLAELERRLTESDPELSHTFRTGRAPRLPRPVLAVYALVAVALLVMAAIVGGFGGAAAGGGGPRVAPRAAAPSPAGPRPPPGPAE